MPSRVGQLHGLDGDESRERGLAGVLVQHFLRGHRQAPRVGESRLALGVGERVGGFLALPQRGNGHDAGHGGGERDPLHQGALAKQTLLGLGKLGAEGAFAHAALACAETCASNAPTRSSRPGFARQEPVPLDRLGLGCRRRALEPSSHTGSGPSVGEGGGVYIPEGAPYDPEEGGPDCVVLLLQFGGARPTRHLFSCRFPSPDRVAAHASAPKAAPFPRVLTGLLERARLDRSRQTCVCTH